MVDRLQVLTLAVLVAVLSFVTSKPTPPPYIECTDSSECGKDECCTIGLGRFTIPVCRRLLDIDEMCRPEHEAISANVVYPDGNAINLTNVYYNFCPCQNHLSCSTSKGTCFDPVYHVDLNDIYDDNAENDSWS